FQAEDGIRDFHVTGVQTCALPISRLRGGRSSATSSIASTSAWCSGLKRKASKSSPLRRAWRSSCSTPRESSRSTPVASNGRAPAAAASRRAAAIPAACSSVQLPSSRGRSLSIASMLGLVSLAAVMRLAIRCSNGRGYRLGQRLRAMLPGMPAPILPTAVEDYAARVAFVVELAEHLHAYGTTAQRLEGAVVADADEPGLACEPRVHPTGMVLSFSDPKRPVGLSDITRVIRAHQGDTDLSKLSAADRTAAE